MIQTPDISQQIIQGDRNRALWVGSVLSDLFGISSPIYLPWGADKSFPPAGYENIRLTGGEEGDALSMLGTPVFGVVTFLGGDYNMYDRESGRVTKVKYGDYTLPYSCICEFSRESNVITTETLGNTGTVKELFGLGDWNISIKGIAADGIDKVKLSAHQQIESLVKWQNLSDSIGVDGDMFRGKGIYNIVIKSLDVQPIEAKYHVIPFQIEAVSDEPLELTL
jgi:hypothetical protein